MEYLPSKKLQVALALVILVGGVGFLLVKSLPHLLTKASSASLYQRPTDQLAAAAAIAEVDSDRDGLKDWEESLWKSDPRNGDTDRDGLSDGDEVKTGHSPIKAGPNDLLGSKNSKDPLGYVPENLSETDKLAREFFARYLQASNGGKEQLTNEQQERIALDITSKADIPIKETYFLSDDIKKIPASRDNIETYGRKIANLLFENQDLFNLKDLELIQTAFSTEDPKERVERLSELSIFLKKYERIVTQLRDMDVPENALPSHLSLINGYQVILDNERKFKDSGNDPLSSLIALKGYKAGSAMIAQSLIELKAYFAESNMNLPITIIPSTNQSAISPSDFQQP